MLGQQAGMSAYQAETATLIALIVFVLVSLA